MFSRLGDLFTDASLWIWKTIQLNLTWFLHIVMGGVVLGIFPATVSLFAITRKWLQGGRDEPFFNEYHHYYKRNFWKVNSLGWIYFSVGLFLSVDLYLVTQLKGIMALFSTVLILFICILYVFSFLYFFPYYVHFDQSFKHYLYQPFIMTIISFKQNLILSIGLTMVGYLIYQMPGLIPFALGVMPAYWVMKVSMNRYKQLHVEMIGGES
ncbi:YesL family protein [uncultured Rossellomorea sp.]|uniref:YesL family protein n=1 Tax=uncultured Rossellomorea sp. TaxID=2837549 RepID=UPI00262E8F56|nr:YesL family protein [uncultured Rossellomorea sp.]